LISPDQYEHSEDTLRDFINGNNCNIYHRSNTHEFVHPMTHSHFFWEKTFPMLFPYGHGGPSDPRNQLKNFGEYVKSVLSRGGGHGSRRFQNSPQFIFAAFTMEMRRKIGGVSATAAKNSMLNKSQMNQKDDVVTVKDMTDILTFLNGGVSSNDTSALTPSIKDLLQRLTPFSKGLKGTPMHMALERKKLYATIQSPVIAQNAHWRYFVTFAPSETHDPRLFDIVANYTHNNDPYSQIQKENLLASKKLKYRPKQERLEILSTHPALSARLFEYKQNSIWKCVLQGQDKPLGEISDFWRRIEVN